MQKSVADRIYHLDRVICRRISNITANSAAHKLMYHTTLQLIIDMLTALTHDIPFHIDCQNAHRSYNLLHSFLTEPNQIDKLCIELKKHPKSVIEETIDFYRGRLESYIYYCCL